MDGDTYADHSFHCSLRSLYCGNIHFHNYEAGIIFYIRGGIKWRDTLYTKEQLQSGRLWELNSMGYRRLALLILCVVF